MIHNSKIGLVKESLIEMMHVAAYCIEYKKTDKSLWGLNATGGILGFPSTILLFSVIDCLGSIFLHNNLFKVIVDGKERNITNTAQHIYILNSKYFNLDLSQIDLENIYQNVRSTLTHNSLLPEGYYLQIGESENQPFKIAISENGERIYFVNLIPLNIMTKKAVQLMLQDIDNGEIEFEKSSIIQNISKRDLKTPIYADAQNPEQYVVKVKNWVKE